MAVEFKESGPQRIICKCGLTFTVADSGSWKFNSTVVYMMEVVRNLGLRDCGRPGCDESGCKLARSLVILDEEEKRRAQAERVH